MYRLIIRKVIYLAKSGRPTKYKKEYCEQAYKLCLLGATDKELSDFFGVTESTLNLWKKNHAAFSESLKMGKVEADAIVAEKLYKKATGYNKKCIKFATYEGLITDSREYEEEVAPDTTAAIFWLKNRQPAKWRDKQDIEHSGQMAVVIEDDVHESED